MRYYTSAQARHVLGNISANKLKQYVDAGILKRYIPPARKQGLYSKTEVDALAEEIHRFYGDDEKEEEHGAQSGAPLDHTGSCVALAR